MVTLMVQLETKKQINSSVLKNTEWIGLYGN